MWKHLISTPPRQWSTLPLRLSLGLIFLGHGSQKLFGMFGGPGLEKLGEIFQSKLGLAPGLFWATLAASGEFFGGLLVTLGLLTRFGALNLAIVMLVAMFKAHWGSFFLPSGIEYTLALLGSSLALLITGGGPVSVDARIQKNRWGVKQPARDPAGSAGTPRA